MALSSGCEGILLESGALKPQNALAQLNLASPIFAFLATLSSRCIGKHTIAGGLVLIRCRKSRRDPCNYLRRALRSDAAIFACARVAARVRAERSLSASRISALMKSETRFFACNAATNCCAWRDRSRIDSAELRNQAIGLIDSAQRNRANRSRSATASRDAAQSAADIFEAIISDLCAVSLCGRISDRANFHRPFFRQPAPVAIENSRMRSRQTIRSSKPQDFSEVDIYRGARFLIEPGGSSI